MIRFSPVGRIVALSAAMAATSLSVGAQTSFQLTFGAFRSDQTVEWQATPGGDIYESGFGVFAAFGTQVGPRNALGTWGVVDDNPELLANVPRNLGPTSGALWGTQFLEQINIFREDPIPFSMRSIDLAHMYSRNYTPFGALTPFTLRITGFKVNGSSIFQDFQIPVPSIVGADITPQFNTYLFDSRWTDLNEIAWLQGSGSGTVHQFSNVQGVLAPEPSTYVLMGIGLIAVFFVRRRRVA